MEIINWKKTSDFLSVLESIRGHEDDVVISVANRVNVGWYHIRLFLTLYPDRKIAFLTRDDRVRNLAKLSGCKVYTHPQELHNYLPSDFQIVQENLS